MSNNAFQTATVTLGTYSNCSATAGSNTITCPSADNPQGSVHWIGNSISVVGGGTLSGSTLQSSIIGIGGAGIFYTRDTATQTSSTATVTVTGYAGYAGALAALEAHGSGETITGNTVVGYNKFLQLAEATTNTETLVANNNIDTQAAGIDIWGYPKVDHTGNTATDSYSMDAVVIAGNTIRIHQMTYYSPNAQFAATGIYCDAGSTLPFRNVRIQDNIIKYDPESVQASQPSTSISVSSNVATITVATPVILQGSDTVSQPDYVILSGASTGALNKTYAVTHVNSTTSFTVATSGVSNGSSYSATVGLIAHRGSNDFAIGCNPNNTGVSFTNLAIVNNTIDRAPAAAIRFGNVTITGLKIDGNQIRDAGSTPDTTLGSAYTSAILWNLSTPLTDVTVTGNNISDDLSPTEMPYAFNLTSGSGTSNVVFKDNYVNVTGAPTNGFLGYFNLDANTNPLVQMIAPNIPWSSFSTHFAVGSRVWDQTSNKMYQVLSAGQAMVAGSLSLMVPAPATTGLSCTPGTFAYGSGYYYACQPNNTWGRTVLSTY